MHFCNGRGKKNHEHFALQDALTVDSSEEKQFSSFQSFMEWKQEIEKETLTTYVIKWGSHYAADNTKIHYYKCHRSGAPDQTRCKLHIKHKNKHNTD